MTRPGGTAGLQTGIATRHGSKQRGRFKLPQRQFRFA